MGKCGAICEVFSRVCGYFRPVSNWHAGKKSEFQDRKTYAVPDAKTMEVSKNARKHKNRKA